MSNQIVPIWTPADYREVFERAAGAAEHWLPVVGYEGLYEVSDLGRVRSVPRVIERKDGTSMRVAGGIRKPVPNTHGYLTVRLSRGGSGTGRDIHVLVTQAFIGPRPTGMVTRHLNGDQTDCRLSNLCYGTQSENNYDKVRHGTDHNARKTRCRNGHPLSGDNLIAEKTNGKGQVGRGCKACASDSSRRWYEQNREKRREYLQERGYELRRKRRRAKRVAQSIAAIRAVADECREVRESRVLADIMEREGLR